MPRTSRRAWLAAVASLGVGTPVFQRALAAMAEPKEQITPEDIARAQWVAGIELSEEERRRLAGRINRLHQNQQRLRALELDNAEAPMLHFRPLRDEPPPGQSQVEVDVRPEELHPPRLPKNEDDLAFLPVAELAALLRSGKVTSVELTQLYLKRLKKYDPVLRCVVTLTEKLAMKQAHRADRELAAGHYRGPLHGVPWGAKDLVAVPGYPTTWGAPQFAQQERGEVAAVYERLERAGAVLVAKLSLGALAAGDRWFRGQTRNPWNVAEGSSGSSAGSAAAVAAGLVPFVIGSETNGSIISPCRRCGVTGLRPSFGRVSRYGCMTLAWSMDKLGPIARTAQDCALVFGVIQGRDPRDESTVARPFRWPVPPRQQPLRVGYFPKELSPGEKRVLELMTEMGCRLQPIQFRHMVPVREMGLILDAEAACAFDPLLRHNDLEGLNYWRTVFPSAQFITAVEYLRANRLRRLLAEQMNTLFKKVDLYLGGDDLTAANLCGLPAIALPVGTTRRNGHMVPETVKFTGPLDGEETLLAVAHALQQRLDAHLLRPPLDKWLRQQPDASQQ